MKHSTIALLGLATLFATAACHKAKPVAAKPADTTPVASAPAERPAPPLQQRPSAPDARQAPQENRPGAQLTPVERATLNEKLAHLNDALFDYDKATIRED